jgi:elongation factor G
MHKPADRIRNVALVGHRGSGKTSLNEALLFQAGQVNRLGSVLDGTTVSDADPDEKARQMSISAALASFEWRERKVNLIDTPGDSSFVADALGALRVCESAIFVVNAVMGVEVHTTRLWQRAAELDLARLMFVNMLDREVSLRRPRRGYRNSDRFRARGARGDRPRRHEGLHVRRQRT